MPLLTAERSKHAPPALIYRAATIKEGNLMIERPLTKTTADIAPSPAKAATFRWILKTPEAFSKAESTRMAPGSTDRPSYQSGMVGRPW